MKYARMPDEPLTQGSSPRGGSVSRDEVSSAPESESSEEEDSEEEREQRLKQLQEQVSRAIMYATVYICSTYKVLGFVYENIAHDKRVRPKAADRGCITFIEEILWIAYPVLITNSHGWMIV